MSAVPHSDPFVRAHLEAVNAVHTFLPSLAPKPPAGPSVPPPQVSPSIQEGTRAAGTVAHVELASRRVARGLPPEPSPPPSPQETFPPAIDQVHIRALSEAIAAHPREMRPGLQHEAHQNLTKWIGAHNGAIMHDGHMQVAATPGSAENLAAKIVNEAVDDHDQREQEKKNAALGLDSNGKPASPAGSDSSSVPDLPSKGKGTAASTPKQASPNVRTDQPKGSATALPSVGAIDPSSGRPVTQPTDDLDDAQELATAAAPDLKNTLGQVAAAVPGANVDGVREEKDPARAQQKVEVDDKPVNTQTDLLAGRVAVDSPEAKDAAVAQLKAASPVIDEEDNFEDGDPDYGFRSHTLQTVQPNGSSAEVQVVPQEIADADQDTHATYEQGREAEAAGDDSTAQQAMDDNTEVHDDAMDKFNARNDKISEVLAAAGIKLSGKPIRVRGHSFLPIAEEDHGENQTV